jgi:prophage regulatory protein
MAESMNQQPVIIRRKQLENKIGLGCSAIYDRLNPKSPRYDPTFPKPIELGGGKNPPIGWLEGEVNDWLFSKIEKSRSKNEISR